MQTHDDAWKKKEAAPEPKILTKEEILQANDLVTERVDVPEWGGAVYVRGMTGLERDLYEDSILEQRGKNRQVNLRNARAKLVALSVVDEAGQRMFSQTDVAALGKKNAAALQRVFNVATRLSGITEEDLEELTEEIEANPFDGSVSD